MDIPGDFALEHRQIMLVSGKWNQNGIISLVTTFPTRLHVHQALARVTPCSKWVAKYTQSSFR